MRAERVDADISRAACLHLQGLVEEATAAMREIDLRYTAQSAVVGVPTVSSPTVSEQVVTMAHVDEDESTLEALDTQLVAAIAAAVPGPWLSVVTLSSASMRPPQGTHRTDNNDDVADRKREDGVDEGDEGVSWSAPQCGALCATGYSVLAQVLRMRRALIAKYGCSAASPDARCGPSRGEEVVMNTDAIGDSQTHGQDPPPRAPRTRSHVHAYISAQLEALRQREDECFDNALALERASMLATSGVFTPSDASDKRTDGEAATRTQAESPDSHAGHSSQPQHPMPARASENASLSAVPSMDLSYAPSDTASATNTITSDLQLLKLSLRRGQHAAERGDGATAAEDFALLHSLLFHKLLLVEELVGYALASAEEVMPATSASTRAEGASTECGQEAPLRQQPENDVGVTSALFDPGEHLMLPPGLDDEDYEEERLYFAQKEERARAYSAVTSDTGVGAMASTSTELTAQREDVVRCLRQLLAKVHADALPLKTLESRFRLLLTSAISDGRAAIGARESSILLTLPAHTTPGASAATAGAAPSVAVRRRDDVESLMPNLQRSVSQYPSCHARSGAVPGSPTDAPSHFSLTVLLGQLAWNTAFCEWVEGDVPHARDWLLSVNLPKLVRRTRTAMHHYAVASEAAGAQQHAHARAGGSTTTSSTTHTAAADVGFASLPASTSEYREDPTISCLDVPTISWEHILNGTALYTPPSPPPIAAQTNPSDAATTAADPLACARRHEREAAALLDNTLSLLQCASTLLAVCDILIQCRSTDDVVYVAHTFSWALAQHARRRRSGGTRVEVCDGSEDVTAEALLLLNHCVEHLLSRRACKLYIERCAITEREAREARFQWGSRTDLHVAARDMMMDEDVRATGSVEEESITSRVDPLLAATVAVREDAESDVDGQSETSRGSTRSSESASISSGAGAVRAQVDGAEPPLCGNETSVERQARKAQRPDPHRRGLLTPEQHEAMEMDAVRIACDELVFAFTGGALPTLESLEAHGVPFPGVKAATSASSASASSAGASVLRPGLSTTLASNALGSVLNFSTLFRTSPHYQALKAGTRHAYRRHQRRAARAVRRGVQAATHRADHGTAQRTEKDEVDTSDEASALLGYVAASYAGRTARETVQRYRHSHKGERGSPAVVLEADNDLSRAHARRRGSGAESAPRDEAATADNRSASQTGGGWLDAMRGAVEGLFAAVVPPSPASAARRAGYVDPLRTRTGPHAMVLPPAVAKAAGTASSHARPSAAVTAPHPVKAPFGSLRLPSCAHTVGGVVLFPYECTAEHATRTTAAEAFTPATEAETDAERDACCVRVLTLLQRYRLLAAGVRSTLYSTPALGGALIAVSSSATSLDRQSAHAHTGTAAATALIPLDEALLMFISQELNKAVHLLPTAVRHLGQSVNTLSIGDKKVEDGEGQTERTPAMMLEKRLGELQRLYVRALAEARHADHVRRRHLSRPSQGHVTQHRHEQNRGARQGPSDVWKERRRCLVPRPAHALLTAVTCDPDEQKAAGEVGSSPTLASTPASVQTSTACAASFAALVGAAVRDTEENRGESAAVPVYARQSLCGQMTSERTEADGGPTTPAVAGTHTEAAHKENLSALWWSKPLTAPGNEELAKRRAVLRSKPDPRRVGEKKAADDMGAPGDPAALLAFAAPPVFIPEVAIDFSGFTTSSVQVQQATKQMVRELHAQQAAAEVAARSEVEKGNVRGVSMLTPACRLLLHNELPILQQYTNWRLIYSTRLHGMSMQTILRCCRKEQDEQRWRRGGGLPQWRRSSPASEPPGPPMLLVMELPPSTTLGFSTDDRGVAEATAAQRNASLRAPATPPHRLLIGAYLSDMLCDETRRYYGTSDTFVFQILLPAPQDGGSRDAAKPQLRAYHGCFGENAHFINVRHAPDSIVIGGGGRGSSIYIDDTLAHGATSGCATFRSPPLTEWLENGSPTVDRSGTVTTDFSDALSSRSFDVVQLEVLVMDS